MSNTFPRSRKSKPGYDVDEVDDFLVLARRAYDSDRSDVVGLTARDIRHTAFRMTKGGYSTVHVDAALERLEDAFASRERLIGGADPDAWFAQARETAQVVLNRLSRPDSRRFARTSVLTVGYNRQDVDAFGKRVTNYFQRNVPLSIDEVRTVVFRPQRGGYREQQVDLVLDSVIDVMLAVR
ncbi:DivIVA domain-containing protein [Compostimonas suwonensis]|uniref:DivIVA domain-containing protein n=1 Tax=Compostimonas suwonensis TaxID=1048394 RepID=A0A2M9BZR2_9MICO|nr:DivIVA domain-containing protein [Compostimonas suwonensis]PJJ63575.1 DivIVA domain-containing protein [Compostimonas suwonensis]